MSGTERKRLHRRQEHQGQGRQGCGKLNEDKQETQQCNEAVSETSLTGATAMYTAHAAPAMCAYNVEGAGNALSRRAECEMA